MNKLSSTFTLTSTLTLAVTLMFYMAIANSAEHVQWTQGEEINLEIKLNTERKIIFPEPVRFGNKSKYMALFRHSVIDTVFFITPLTNFDEKIVFQGLISKRFYIVKASVGDGVRSDEKLVIHIVDKLTDKTSSYGSSGPDNQHSPVTPKVSPIDVVQFVAQSLYSPNEALIEPTHGVRRVPISLNYVPNLYQGGVFTANILGG